MDFYAQRISSSCFFWRLLLVSEFSHICWRGWTCAIHQALTTTWETVWDPSTGPLNRGCWRLFDVICTNIEQQPLTCLGGPGSKSESRESTVYLMIWTMTVAQWAETILSHPGDMPAGDLVSEVLCCPELEDSCGRGLGGRRIAPPNKASAAAVLEWQAPATRKEHPVSRE